MQVPAKAEPEEAETEEEQYLEAAGAAKAEPQEAEAQEEQHLESQVPIGTKENDAAEARGAVDRFSRLGSSNFHRRDDTGPDARVMI